MGPSPNPALSTPTEVKTLWRFVSRARTCTRRQIVAPALLGSSITSYAGEGRGRGLERRLAAYSPRNAAPTRPQF